MPVRIWCVLALAWLIVPAAAHADAGPPTAAQLARAKQAFAEGKQLHDAGKLGEAIEKFEQSYELSHNPFLLYNIALTMEELGSADLAVVYYRRFLAEAAPDAAHRQDATDRIAAITRGPPPAGPPPAGPPPTEPSPAGPPPTEPSPAGPAAAPTGAAVSDAGFGHHPVEAAPPGKPLDFTAVVPADSGMTVTVFFRTAGQASFTSTPMLWHHQQLVGRVPASRMTGSTLQYYLEVRAPSGALVARSGKPTSPNVVAIDAGAAPQVLPDVAEPVLTEVVASRDAEDPFAHPAAATGDGLLDVGSPKFRTAKWSATAVAGAGVGLGITLYLLARDHARALEDDATGCGAPPCQKFDDFDQGLERTGKREQTISNVALAGGIAAAAIAGYFWYRELTAGAHGEGQPARGRSGPAAAAWRVIPVLGSLAGDAHDGVTGAAAAVRF